MNFFLDTSALVKLFYEESGSDVIEDIVLNNENLIYVSELVRLEFLSSIHRRYRQKELTEEEVDSVFIAFDEQIQNFNVEPMRPSVIKASEQLMKESSEQLMKEYGKIFGLRSLDAIHLGTCRLIAGVDWFFVCADSKLCDVAKECGITVRNPMAPSYKYRNNI